MGREDSAPGCARVSVGLVSGGPADLCSVLSSRMSVPQAHSLVSAFLQSKVSTSGAKGMQAYWPS